MHLDSLVEHYRNQASGARGRTKSVNQSLQCCQHFGSEHYMMKSSRLLVSDTLIIEPQLIKHAASASKCQSTLQLPCDRLAGPASRKRSMEDQQVDHVLQYELCKSDKGPPMGERLYYPK